MNQEENIAQSPANDAKTQSNFWTAPVMIVYLDGEHQVSWIGNVVISTKVPYVNVRSLLEIQAMGQEHFLKAMPSKTQQDIVNTVVMGVNHLGLMYEHEYLDDITKKMLNDQRLAAIAQAQG